MKNAKKITAVMFSIVTVICSFFGCSNSGSSTPVAPEDFRVTAYVTQEAISNLDTFSSGHIDEVTDVILFGVVTFDEKGKISLAENFDTCYNNIKTVMQGKENKRLFINMLGPESQSDSEDWYEQMADKAERHSGAFESEGFCEEILKLLDKYDFDGVFFDYEFPIKNKYWKTYNKFIVKLDEVLGDDYKIGMALASWDAKQNKKAREATDLVCIMSYDLWDDNGNHATMDIAKDDVDKFVKKGYDKSKLDLGLPFYARPTTQDAYWYDYGSYYDKMDASGLYKDSETGLTFSFNTYDLIKEKTTYALDSGLGGVMVWCWNYDTDYGNEKSLFKAVSEAKNARIESSK